MSEKVELEEIRRWVARLHPVGTTDTVYDPEADSVRGPGYSDKIPVFPRTKRYFDSLLAYIDAQKHEALVEARVRAEVQVVEHENVQWQIRHGQEQQRALRAEVERDELAQAMWQARAILGFDNDGAATPQAMIAGMGWEGFRTAFLRDMQQQRDDYDAALNEIPDPKRKEG